jgi:hypothetical protein
MTDEKSEKKNESKHDKFKRLASARTQTVLQKLDVLINCANGNNYEWTPEDGTKIVDVVQAKVDELKDKLLGGDEGNAAEEAFAL